MKAAGSTRSCARWSREQATPMPMVRSILRALPFAARGKSGGDKAKIFLVIAFETTSFANPGRRARIKKLLRAMSRQGLLTLRFSRDGEDFTFDLRAAEDGDLSVASEFIRGGYDFPTAKSAQIIDGGGVAYSGHVAEA